jgi:RimJ/RimL family protein N-acetyltransferase
LFLPQVIRIDAENTTDGERLLEGKNVNLRVVEKEDVPLIAEWENSLDYISEYNPLRQRSRADQERNYDKIGPDEKWFLIEKKDGSKIGFILHSAVRGYWDIGYVLVPGERGKGYCTEAVQIIVDYLFLSKDTVRIQAETHVENMASQKVLERTGFKREGRVREEMFVWGKWADGYLYSILREEWKEPKILTRTT